ncbi:hypothetical protein PVAP13_4KG133405 [Panicum virgatum]|uniref:Uncharacterized protein n=1 Tax=Panicum virgatum TaxID=38727 RepID=A0A8T0TR27_PANVG|nr:hypothetical protein PVAP13_4KG133405 [Panicum virgatum]KAG2611246.1 hypothetical protein PVAP13_4KG133405 [Panicum virgatum]
MGLKSSSDFNEPDHLTSGIQLSAKDPVPLCSRPRPPRPVARAAPARPLQAATLPLPRRSRWPSFLPGQLPLRPGRPRLRESSSSSVAVAVAAVPVPRRLRHPPLPPAARARRRAGAGAASLPVADQPHASLQPQRQEAVPRSWC